MLLSLPNGHYDVNFNTKRAKVFPQKTFGFSCTREFVTPKSTSRTSPIDWYNYRTTCIFHVHCRSAKIPNLQMVANCIKLFFPIKGGGKIWIFDFGHSATYFRTLKSALQSD